MSTILIVDDERGIRDTIARFMEKEGYEAVTAADADEAFEALGAGAIDVMISDIIMPGASGVELLRRAQELSPHSKVILITGEPTLQTASEAVRLGAFDYLPKPIPRSRLSKAVADAVRFKEIEDENRRYSEHLEERVAERTARLRHTLQDTVEAFCRAMETRDPYTATHQRRVSQLAEAIGAELGLEEERLVGLRMGGLLHDLGKLRVPAEILAKPGRLTELEMGLVKEHANTGFEILERIDFPWPLAQVVLQHHERLDGSGYPAGLSGDAILQEARIIGVADVVEAMASHRPYRPALGLDVALDEIRKHSGTRYDAEVVEACEALFKDGGFEL